MTRILPGFVMQAGDISAVGDGTGGKGIYAEGDWIYNKDGRFDDENIWFPHSHKGTLSTHQNHDEKNMNGSQFIINLRDDNQYFDERATLFGRIISGFDFIEQYLSNIPREEEKPKRPVRITKCGELRFEDKLLKEQCENLKMYEITEEQEKAMKKRFRYKEHKEEDASKVQDQKLQEIKEQTTYVEEINE